MHNVCRQTCLYGGSCTTASTCSCNSESPAAPKPPSAVSAAPPSGQVDGDDATIRDDSTSHVGRRILPFPALNETQRLAPSDLLRQGGEFRQGCNAGSIVCDTDGNVLEVNHALAVSLDGPASALRLNGESLRRLPKLRVLECGVCQLRGTIPRELGLLPELSDIELFNNQLTGALPPTLGSLDALRIMVLSNNLLKGTLPQSLGSLELLDSFDLSFNKLTGALPESLYSLDSLSSLRLNDNGPLHLFQSTSGTSRLLWLVPERKREREKERKKKKKKENKTDVFLIRFALPNVRAQTSLTPST